MIALAILLGVVSVAAVIGTVVTTLRDGYRRVPERRYARVV